MFDVAIAVVTALMLALTLAPFSLSNHWVFRVWEFPRVQIAIVTLCTLIMSLFTVPAVLSAILIFVNTSVLIYHLVWIFPYTPLYPAQVAKAKKPHPSSVIKILTSNVLMTNHSAGKLIALVEQYQPDIMVTLETDSWWEEALKPIHAEYPHRVSEALDNLYGMHLYSRLPLEEVEVKYLIQDGVPSIHCYVRLSDELKVTCHFLHPAPPSPTENTTSTPRDRELLTIANKIGASSSNEPIIVTGDLNDVAWSPTTRAFRRISGLKDPRIGRGVFNTFHADYPLLRWPLDHIFHSDHFTLGSIQRLPSIDSDHFPLLSELVYESSKS
jgi:endonuclease/exonuclease/phosphatase (EEP) superfamily protein YafD